MLTAKLKNGEEIAYDKIGVRKLTDGKVYIILYHKGHTVAVHPQEVFEVDPRGR